jgi:hypothetical protein
MRGGGFNHVLSFPAPRPLEHGARRGANQNPALDFRTLARLAARQRFRFNRRKVSGRFAAAAPPGIKI